MIVLPSLRRKIFRSFSVMILLYAGLGGFLMLSVLSVSHSTPQVIHVNYDSIAAAIQMRQSWHALHEPQYYPDRSAQLWAENFEKYLKFEEGNITEKGEREIAQSLRKRWNAYQAKHEPATLIEFRELDNDLTHLIDVNETGMFALAGENARLSRNVLGLGGVYFLLTMFFGLVAADGLANRISKPLKSIAEALHRKPAIGRRLKLVEPNTLELLILNTELSKLWERVNESGKVNIKELTQQKTKLETVLESVEDALLVLDVDGKVSHTNRCMLELLNLGLDQVQGQAWRDLPTSADNYIRLRDLFRPEMEGSPEVELLLQGKESQFAARSRRLAGGTVLYLLHDITEKRQREAFRAEFIDLLSHELKTPLQSLGTASELLDAQKVNLNASLHPLVDTIHEDIERIRAVANEFVQVTQSHSKVLKIKLQTLSLGSALTEWIKPFKVVAKDRDLNLNFTIEGSYLIKARIDPVKFPWVISNLLSNAIRFSPAGSIVNLILTDRNGSVEIRVLDQGPGVPDDDRKRIFEPFFQSPAVMTTSGHRGLFGIGLTIAREVVEAHDGRIEYYPRSPHGSEFRISLPFPSTE